MILAVPPTAFDEMEVDYAILDWKSWKLSRVSRSSLNAETQAAAEATDALEFCHSFVALMHDPALNLKQASSATSRRSALVVDAKSLYDALKRESPVQGAGYKRTAIEQIMLRQALVTTSSVIRWVSSERQLADGLTKTSARQLLVDRMQTQRYKLVYDDTFTAQ